MVTLVTALLAAAPVSQEVLDQLAAAELQRVASGVNDALPDEKMFGGKPYRVLAEVTGGLVVKQSSLPNNRFMLMTSAQTQNEANRRGELTPVIAFRSFEVLGDRAKVNFGVRPYLPDNDDSMLLCCCCSTDVFRRTKTGWKFEKREATRCS
jgi:hypothetical protein